MYSTVKEIHVEIEQRIQQITSNRRRSIAPEFIDMVLNRSAISYIDDLLSAKTNAKQEGFDKSTLRLDALQSLKRTVVSEPLDFVRYNDKSYSKSVFTYLPPNYHHLIEVKCLTSSYKNPEDIGTGDLRITLVSRVLDINKLIALKGIGKVELEIQSFTTKRADLTPIINTYDSNYGMFNISNDLKTFFDMNDVCAYYEFAPEISQNDYQYVTVGTSNYYPNCFHLLTTYRKYYKNPITFKLFVDNVEQTDFFTELPINETTKPGNSIGKYSKCNAKVDIVSSEDVNDILSNSYLNKHRYLNPLGTIENGKLTIYQEQDAVTKFILENIAITYIKKPISFNIRTGQMSDITVTPELISKAVSDLLLMLRDGTYQNVQQFSQE